MEEQQSTTCWFSSQSSSSQGPRSWRHSNIMIALQVDRDATQLSPSPFLLFRQQMQRYYKLGRRMRCCCCRRILIWGSFPVQSPLAAARACKINMEEESLFSSKQVNSWKITNNDSRDLVALRRPHHIRTPKLRFFFLQNNRIFISFCFFIKFKIINAN